MAQAVADLRGNAPEHLLHAADVIGKSIHRRKVFEAVYYGKKPVKTTAEICKRTKLSLKEVLMAGKHLADNEIVDVEKVSGRTAYRKVAFYSNTKKAVLRLVDQPAKKAKIPTKRNPVGALRITLPRKVAAKVRMISIDQIDSFSRVKKIPLGRPFTEMAERQFKKGVESILGEMVARADWGGEKNDVFSSRVVVNGRRIPTAFAFKGPATRGMLVPGKMGKNGDQLQRLFSSPAELFVVQYWNGVAESVHEDLRTRALAKSFLEDRPILICVLDGQDSARLIEAYPVHFS